MAELSFKTLSRILLNVAFLVLLISCLITNPTLNSYQETSIRDGINYKGIHQTSQTKEQKCSYVKSHQGCKPRGHIPYLHFFYCTFSPFLAYLLLSLWLVVLFYLLGDTASNYFCHSLEGLSRSFHLSPTISGVSLLSLGNGAPDIFASIISFTGDGTVDIGLNSTLGAAFFVSCVVFGIISISVDKSRVRISMKSFITILMFLLLSLIYLALIVIVGHISLFGAISFLLLYFIYVFVIFLRDGEDYGDAFIDRSSNVNTPLLGSIPYEGPDLSDQVELQNSNQQGKVSKYFDIILCMLQLPLDLPRRLTIPLLSTDKWSKPYAIISSTLAPLVLGLSCHFSDTKTRVLTCAIAGSTGAALGVLLFFTSERINPPRKCKVVWFLEGFIMSITWTYILAQELVSLLVSLSLILGVNQSLIGLTVLAWGNSIGDLVANVAMSKHGGLDGAQVATSGCFAGPVFNVLVGLGLSLCLSAWKSYPNSYAISVGDSIFVTFGFFVLGLVWALVVLLKENMRIGKCLGCGLIAIYTCFLSLQIVISLGIVEFQVPNS